MKAIALHRVNNVLITVILITVILFYGKKVLIILSFSMLLAMLMSPVANNLEAKGGGRVVSTILCLLIVIVFLIGIISLISAQVISFIQDLPKVQSMFEKYLQDVQLLIQEKFSVSSERQIAVIKQQARTFIQSAGSFLKSFITGFAGIIGSTLLILVFMFLMLLEREKYKTFFLKLYKGENPEEAKKVLEKISKVSQKYLWGRFLSIIILTIMYTIGLLILGIKNPVLLSAIAALLTIIPYIGPVIGGLFPFFMAVITQESFGPALGVIIVITLIQTIDNYFIEPYVVGGEVKLSVIATILILLIGGFLWGIAGVILFLPLFGIVKVIFDHVDALQPYGYLIGDQKQQTPSAKIWEWMKSHLKGK